MNRIGSPELRKLTPACSPGRKPLDHKVEDWPDERFWPELRARFPAEMAAAISFFCSPDSDYITGQVLSVSGGLTMAGCLA